MQRQGDFQGGIDDGVAATVALPTGVVAAPGDCHAGTLRPCSAPSLPLALARDPLHNAWVILLPQDAPGQASSQVEVLQQLQTLTWVDHTALGVLLVFFVIGLFKGLIWQVSRIAILVASYVVAGRFGGDVANLIAGSPAGTAIEGGVTTPETTVYLAYVLLFLGVLIVLSLLAMLLQKLAAKAGLGFFDRIGGGVLGVATGACVVLFGLFVVQMFFRGSQLALASEQSASLRLSRGAIDLLGDKVPDDLRVLLQLPPLHPAAAPAKTSALPPLPGAPTPADAAVPTEPPPPPQAPPTNRTGERKKQ